MSAERSHGGKRAGAGRPSLGPAKLQRVDVRLTADDIAYLRSLGAGNLSAGVRRLVAERRTGEDERANMTGDFMAAARATPRQV
jgi:hypothetical protein